MQLRLDYPFRLALLPGILLLAMTSAALAQDNSSVAVAPQAALPAQVAPAQTADWRDEIGTFKIGLVRGWSSDMSRLALARVEKTFAKSLDTPVKVVVFERFTSLMDAQADGRIDMAAYSARAFVTLGLMCECVEALATPATLAGQTGQIAVIAGDKTRISNLASLGAAKLGRIATSKLSGGDMLRGALAINGKSVSGTEDYWVDFSDFAAAAQAYNDNQIDGFMIPASASLDALSQAGTAELARLSEIDTGSVSRTASVLWRSAFWPYGPITVRSNLAPEAKSILLRTLEQLDVADPLVHATLSEGLAGPFRKSDMTGFNTVSTSIRLLVSQNANWR